ncbi:P-loop containing nucleoside triphosphate hydrolase protein [Suillus fuscotomentosus]|uniref:P-loop containing nucleoside triphosphate hydrolase protein n=1 Tax=Suillus fuscotomentosus TaxID=1912939 RepID=A0AAD4EER0_9AGAM|nr:P-loop containing nucleoside triphosphate hydrolase protein [Suillus fuscotomentosus]KAG1904898.1 P-loop containing nucleoside triphosphate hydrolase protein [Suillus fuscotomentosus]
MASFPTSSPESSTSHTPDYRVTHSSSHAVENSHSEIVRGTDTTSAFRYNIQVGLMSSYAMVLACYLDTPYPNSPSSPSRTPDHSAVPCKYLGLEEASRRKDTCNVVIFGQTGAGKTSLVNLITAVPTSPDAEGCTRQTIVYGYDAVAHNRIVKVQLFDTAGLDEDSEGTDLNEQAQMGLKKLIRTLMTKGGIHLLVYCVQGTDDASALQRNYKLIDSEVKARVPVVLVVTGLENREPDMEEWWRSNERSILDLGMKFAGHACITALTINEGGTDGVRQRREESYHAVCDLIAQCYSHDGTGMPNMRRTKNIVLFGEAGAGKSSVVNLMAGSEVAKTSLGIQRCTLDWQDYVIDFGGESYKVFDTMGIEESGLEKKEYLAAAANAYRFIKTLDAEGGVDLLLFCVRAGRFTAALQSNYRFFYEFLCNKKVPIVLAITNLEREQRMEDWWEREHSIFARYQIHVADHACITAANRLEGTHRQFYEDSRVAMRDLVKRNIAGKHNDVWTGGNKVFVALMQALKIFGKNRYIRKNALIGQLKRSGMSPETARELADVIEQGEVTT